MKQKYHSILESFTHLTYTLVKLMDINFAEDYFRLHKCIS